MPIIYGHDGQNYIRFGITGHKYHYNPFIKSSFDSAYAHMLAQAHAIEASKHKKNI